MNPYCVILNGASIGTVHALDMTQAKRIATQRFGLFDLVCREGT